MIVRLLAAVALVATAGGAVARDKPIPSAQFAQIGQARSFQGLGSLANTPTEARSCLRRKSDGKEFCRTRAQWKVIAQRLERGAPSGL